MSHPHEDKRLLLPHILGVIVRRVINSINSTSTPHTGADLINYWTTTNDLLIRKQIVLLKQIVVMSDIDMKFIYTS